MKLRYKILLTVTSLVVLLDQLVKGLIVHFLEVGEGFPVIPGLFDIVHVRNRGAAFGSFATLPDSLRAPFFFIMSTVALVAILIYYVKQRDDQRGPFYSLSLILGGALGNIVDRIFRGEVVDFLSFHWYDRWAQLSLGSFHWRFRLEWPAFNMADSAITVATIWLMIQMLKKPGRLR